MHPSRLALVPLFVLLAGCGGEDKPTGPDPGPPPEIETPALLLMKFEEKWEFQDLPAYSRLLTEDFRFTFSAASDPVLATQYPNWTKADELASMRHLFEGFTNEASQPIPAASRIDLSMNGVQYGPDPNHPDSTFHYGKIIVTVMDGIIEVSNGSEATEYHVNSRHEFYVVRGDAAVLSGDAHADSTHWYVRRWDDLAPPLPVVRKGPVINPSISHSIGSIKALYRN